jgi:tRNA threonylcarbamoyladenosine modification (KEOPS) complex Cgi121 subunit
MENNRVVEFRKLLQEFELDYVKFTEKGNKTAATRARKTLQDIRNLAKDIRVEIMEEKKSM